MRSAHRLRKLNHIKEVGQRPLLDLLMKHNLIVALANDFINSIVKEWRAIESKLVEIVMNHVLSKKTEPVTRFDSGEVYKGYRVTKCLDEFQRFFSSKVSLRSVVHGKA